MATGSSASTLGANSTLEYALGGQGSVPDGRLSVGYGTFTANGASAVTVVDANVTASSIIVPGLTTVGGTVGAIPHVATITPGTGFTVVGTASDTSVYSYLRLG